MQSLYEIVMYFFISEINWLVGHFKTFDYVTEVNIQFMTAKQVMFVQWLSVCLSDNRKFMGGF